MRALTADQFWSKVAIGPDDQCWLWLGAVKRNGYGDAQSRKLGVQSAHRLAYTFAIGPIPNGICVCHRCDVKLCCNPHHLFPGTRAENNRDRTAKNRQARGSDNGNAQLTEWLVKDMRKRYATGKYTVYRLADMFYISIPVAYTILAGKAWKHVR